MDISPYYMYCNVCCLLPLWVIAFKKLKQDLNEATFTVHPSSNLCFDNVNYHSSLAIDTLLVLINRYFIGPSIASVCVSLVLFIQALVFGDGGVTTFGANALFNGFCLFFSSSISSDTQNKVICTLCKRLGECCMFVFGVDAFLKHSTPLYRWFNGQPIISLLALMWPSLLLWVHISSFGVVEGIFTGMAYRYIVKNQHV